METHIQKWGNSLGLRIPNKIIKQLQLHPGSAVNVEIENGRIIIETPKYDLDTMLKDITPQNMHHLLLDDEQQLGNEAW
jgi:antitoxin MazE